MAIGGGDITEADEVLRTFLKLFKRKPDGHLVVLTVATNEPSEAAEKYRSLFRGHDVKHVNVVDVSLRDDAFSEVAVKKALGADAFFFTGGDQLNVTSLMGGTPLHDAIHEKFGDGVLIAGTSAGAAMMSSKMIISGGSGNPPIVGGVDFAPGMNLILGAVIDTHFSQRARHGRLLTAVAHYPHAVGLGIDERTAMVVRGSEFKVLGEGVITVVDGTQMRYCDLPYKKNRETIGMFAVQIHVLPAGYEYNFKTRQPSAPTLSQLVSADNSQ